MANSTPAGMVLMFDNAAGVPVDITQHVTSMNGVSIEQLVENVTSFGDAWEQHSPIGVGKVAPIVLGGVFEDTAATGPDSLFKAGALPDTPASLTRTLTVTWSPGKTTAVECIRQKYDRNAAVNGLTKYQATLQPTGIPAET